MTEDKASQFVDSLAAEFKAFVERDEVAAVEEEMGKEMVWRLWLFSQLGLIRERLDALEGQA